MGEPLVCPVCEGPIEPHCTHEDCSWAKCSDRYCGYIGKPEENRWIPPFVRRKTGGTNEAP